MLASKPGMYIVPYFFKSFGKILSFRGGKRRKREDKRRKRRKREKKVGKFGKFFKKNGGKFFKMNIHP